MDMIGAAVGLLNNLDKLVPVLEQLAIRHEGYGVKEAHYDTVGGALLDTLQEGLGSYFTDEVKEAWTEVYGIIASTMINAVKKNSEINTDSTIKETNMSDSNSAFFMGAIEQSGTASVMIDRDFNITYLVDVRSNPYSKYNPDYTKSDFSKHLKKIYHCYCQF